MRKAFTLIEMLVVIGIIGILAGVLMGTFSGGTESARTARCLSNMKNLSAACQAYVGANTYFPTAGSVEYFTVNRSQGVRNLKNSYAEMPGWIAWYSNGAYGSSPQNPIGSSSWYISMYSDDENARQYCLTNGAIWKYVSGDHSVYICPSHARAKKNLNPNWSYVMNAYFGWTANPGTEAYNGSRGNSRHGRLEGAERILLFAEIPFSGTGVTAPENRGSGSDCDCILQYGAVSASGSISRKDANTGSGASAESIGFNHKAGKFWCANVVFADGHVEKLIYPKTGLSQQQIQDLTAWLCNGLDVSYNGKKYELFTN